jgi:hypothetical protein
MRETRAQGAANMRVILLLVGLVLAAGGVAVIAFGIPISAFGLGNTLIISGTVAFVGGIIVVGLGAVVSRLQRILETLEAHPLPRSVAATPLPAGSEQSPLLAAARAAEPSSAPAARKPPQPVSAEEPRATDSRRAPLRETARSRPASVDAAEASPAAPEPTPRETLSARDSVSPDWPRLDPTDRLVPAFGMAEAPPLRGALEESGGAAPSTESGSAEAPADAPAILKSGVIEGMAYTLYADGSIEAELPQGTMRFGSIPELRSYLRDAG